MSFRHRTPLLQFRRKSLLALPQHLITQQIEFGEAEFGASARNAAPPRGGLEWISWRAAEQIWTPGARLTFPL
jgi:hypothetical protein